MTRRFTTRKFTDQNVYMSELFRHKNVVSKLADLPRKGIREVGNDAYRDAPFSSVHLKGSEEEDCLKNSFTKTVVLL